MLKPYTLDLSKEKVENSLELIGTGKGFLNRTPLAQALRSTIKNETSLVLCPSGVFDAVED